MNSPQPWWHPEALSRRRPHLLARAAIQAGLRHYFAAQGFIEVETPALQVSPGLEPHLQAFATEIEAPGGNKAMRYLHTSPEFAMKKLLAGGAGPIFQFARAYRNGERGPTHHPEFTMLEWYRVGSGIDRLIEDCRELLRAALAAVPGRREFRWRDRVSDPSRMEILSVSQAFARFAGLDLMATIAPSGTPDRERLAKAAAAIGIREVSQDSWDDLFFRIFLERIEPHLGSPHPAVLRDYPIHMAALSRPNPADPRLAERFELYVAGLELANAFAELTDAAEQARRFAADRATAEALYGRAYPVDEDFLAALRFGLPESAGIALGFDRLVLLASGADHIEEVLWAPVEDLP